MATRLAPHPDMSLGTFSENYRLARLCYDALDEAIAAMPPAVPQWSVGVDVRHELEFARDLAFELLASTRSTYRVVFEKALAARAGRREVFSVLVDHGGADGGTFNYPHRPCFSVLAAEKTRMEG